MLACIAAYYSEGCHVSRHQRKFAPGGQMGEVWLSVYLPIRHKLCRMSAPPVALLDNVVPDWPACTWLHMIEGRNYSLHEGKMMPAEGTRSNADTLTFPVRNGSSHGSSDVKEIKSVTL